MIKIHTLGVLFMGLGVSLLGQTQGCNVDAIVNVFGNASTQPSGDDLNDDHGGDDVGDDNDDNGNDDNDGSADAGEIILTTTLGGSGAPHGEAEYRESGIRMRLKVEMEDATPGSVHQVSVNGIVIGDLTIGSLGEGELEFDTEVEPDHLPWPAALSSGLDAGAVIVVGPAQGTLAG